MHAKLSRAGDNQFQIGAVSPAVKNGEISNKTDRYLSVPCFMFEDENTRSFIGFLIFQLVPAGPVLLPVDVFSDGACQMET